jgi:hypothetical protein
MSSKVKVSKRIQAALDAVGNWRLEPGRKHIRIWVNGMMAGICPLNDRGDGRFNGRAELNVISQIRRAARASAT